MPVPGTLDAVLSARDSKGVAVDIWGEGEKKNICRGNMEERDHSKDLGVDGRMILLRCYENNMGWRGLD